MARLTKLAGVALVAVGLALLVGFSVAVARDERFQKAGLYKERNPGNVLYESQYFAAATIHLFLISGAVGGGLVMLNGVTLVLLGTVMTRQAQGVAIAREQLTAVEQEMRG